MKDTKRLFVDIETGRATDYKIFQPEFKPPKLNKDGSVSATSKSVEQQQTDFESKCALSPLTGQVLMVGYAFSDVNIPFPDYQQGKNEDKITEENLLEFMNRQIEGHDLIIGHYIKDFDLPFIINRCRKHGIKPPNVGYMHKGRWQWNENVIDLKDLWTFSKYGEYISLNNMAKFFGLKTKDEKIGERFEQVFNEDIDKAIEYCKHDVSLTKQIYERLK